MKFSELETSTKIIIKIIIAVLGLGFLWVVRDVLIILLFSLVLASAMDPMVEYFSRHRIPRAVSVLTVYVLVFGIVGVIISLLIPPVVSQFKILGENLPEFAQNLQFRLGGVLQDFSLSDLVTQAVNSFGGAGQTVVSGTFGVFNGVLTFITILVISFYLVAEKNGMKSFVATLVPIQHHDFVLGLIEKIQKKMGLWIIGQIILSASIFVITYAGLSILGVQYALVLALLAGLLEVVPYIGPWLSAVPAILVAFVASPPLAIAVAVLYLIIQKTEGYILVPKVMEKTVGVSPLAVLVAVLIGLKLAGIVGILLAVPLVGAFTVVVNELWAPKQPT